MVWDTAAREKELLRSQVLPPPVTRPCWEYRVAPPGLFPKIPLRPVSRSPGAGEQDLPTETSTPGAFWDRPLPGLSVAE